MQNLIISVEEARKLLGESADKMPDEEVEKLILDLDFFARAAIRSYLDDNQKQAHRDSAKERVR